MGGAEQIHRTFNLCFILNNYGVIFIYRHLLQCSTYLIPKSVWSWVTIWSDPPSLGPRKWWILHQVWKDFILAFVYVKILNQQFLFVGYFSIWLRTETILMRTSISIAFFALGYKYNFQIYLLLMFFYISNQFLTIWSKCYVVGHYNFELLFYGKKEKKQKETV